MWDFDSSGAIVDCMYEGKPVRLTDPGHAEILRERIMPLTLCDMIHDAFPCPKGSPGKPHRRGAIRLCANRKGKIFSIILELTYTVKASREEYHVTHVKPI